MKMTASSCVYACVVTAAVSFAEAADHAHWTYSGQTGPAHWAQIESEFVECGRGHHQSPIDIDTKKVASDKPETVALAYAPVAADVENTGHTIQISPAGAGSVTIDGVAYHLVQFHFHTPSEETIDRRHAPLEAHFVHKDADGKLAVIAVMFKLGQANAALAPIFSKLPAKSGGKHKLDGAVDVNALLPRDHADFTYIGSLTTPPCTENVKWIVMKTPMTISAAQLAAFRKVYRMNARPTQPVNDRIIQSGQ